MSKSKPKSDPAFNSFISGSDITTPLNSSFKASKSPKSLFRDDDDDEIVVIVDDRLVG